MTQQVALLSLIPIAVLGVVLARVLQTQTVARTLADEGRTARLIAQIGIQPRLTPGDLQHGLGAGGVRALDAQLLTPGVKRDLARIKIWNARGAVIYSDDHSLIGRTLTPSDDLEHALAGHPNKAVVVNPRANSETAGEVGLGTLVEVYVPLRFSAAGRPDGAFEMYLSYRPVASAIRSDTTTIALLVAIGLAILWLVLYRIVARASRRLRHQARENSRLARYDQLTGLPNRILFTERLRGELRRRHDSETAAVLMVDVEGFRQINSTLGNATGDQVLREVGRRLRSELAERTLVARLGNDEFAVLCPHTGAGDARELAGVIQRSFESPVVLDGVALNIEVNIGLATSTDRYETPDELLQHAEAALARARAGGSPLEVYSAETDRFDPSRLILLGQVRSALDRHEFVLRYQPKIDLLSGRMSGVEALLGWEHPERGLLGPMEFIPLIEPTALVGPLTLYVLDEAARQLAAWRERGIDLDISVNLSTRNLLDEELPARMFEILRRHGVPGAQLTVEVTESATMADTEKATSVLESLRAAGVSVSIDDFGTGNASIEYLARLPANEIKIDKSFITPICEDTRAEAIVRSTIALARHLELNVVAEGIETAAVLERVTLLGADTGQGYLISRPATAEELGEQLEASEHVGPATSGVHAPLRAGAVARPDS